MSTLLPTSLPKMVTDLIDQPEPIGIIVTAHDRGRPPHPALISPYETFLFRKRLHFVLHNRSRTSELLRSSGLVTLLYVLPEAVYYLKGQATFRLDYEALAVFALELAQVLTDRPSDEEGDTSLRTGITFSASEGGLRRRQELGARVQQALLVSDAHRS